MLLKNDLTLITFETAFPVFAAAAQHWAELKGDSEFRGRGAWCECLVLVIKIASLLLALDQARISLFIHCRGSDALQILKSQKREKGPMKIDHVIGSDLIFAKEGIEPLAKTYEALCHASGATGWLACILRFKWEASFFELMDKKFDSEVVHKEAEISIYKFTPRLQTVHVQARAREEKDNGI